MSILLDALKKSQKDKPIISEAVPSRPSAPPSPPDNARFPLVKISITFALFAMAAYILMGTLTGKTPMVTAKPSPTLPTQSQNNPAVAVPLLPNVEGILWDPQTPMAILDGKPLKIGDSVQGWTITAITSDQVNLSREGLTKTLSLPPAQDRP